ncbi:MAG: hypothetical protein M3O36_04640, partial [Myxococcota bacterium]|nr:hypothetical protein [Myxococcota bacterium]
MPSPPDLWQQLVDEAGEDEIARAAGVNVARAEQELAASAFDVAAERAKATAVLGAIESSGVGRQGRRAVRLA